MLHNDIKEILAKFGYKVNMKIKHLKIFWLHA